MDNHTGLQYKLRLPSELKQQIEESAKNQNRSMNADITARLYESFTEDGRTFNDSINKLESLFLKTRPSIRRSEISERLNYALNEVNAIRRGRPLKPSHVAQGIGESYAEAVEDWFLGKQEPSFSQLATIADFFGVDRDWMQHGDSTPFMMNSSRIPYPAEDAMRWFLDLDAQIRPTDIYLVREKSDTGAFLVIKQYNDWRCTVHSTPYHVSESIGAGGESALMDLMVTFRLLYAIYVKTPSLMVRSFILNPSDFSAILRGNHHPLKPLLHAPNLSWWEDIWDPQMFDKDSYWSGWASLCHRLVRGLEHKPAWQEAHQLIASGQNPFIEQGHQLYVRKHD